MTATTQTVACPTWCTVPIQEHLAERPEWEGGDIHHCTVLWGEPTGRQAACRRPEKVFMAGMGSEEDPVLIYADLHPDNGMTPVQAREVVAALLQAADLLERSSTPADTAGVLAAHICAAITAKLDTAGIGTTEAADVLDLPEHQVAAVLANLPNQRVDYLHRLAVAAGTTLADVVAEAEQTGGDR